MPVVFDEVVGSVAPGPTPQAEAEAERQERQAEPEIDARALRRELRCLARRQARLRAD